MAGQLPTGIQALAAFVERLQKSKPNPDWMPSTEPPDFSERRLKTCAPPELTRFAGNVDEARQMIRSAIRNYLDNPMPQHMLLVRALPGTGKTTAAAEIVDELAISGVRVAYAGPRHAFFTDVLDKSMYPQNWYEWLPRQLADDDAGKPETCRYSEQIGSWLVRGYEAMGFCSGVCGWDYVNQTCPYHAQKRRGEPVIYIQHQHVSLGHPLQFGVLFGDESPISAFLREWEIPARWILPPGMDPTDPMSEILHLCAGLAQSAPRYVEGPELLDLLGGAQYVFETCQAFSMPASALAMATIHRPEEADQEPYFHLPYFVQLLAREARAAMTGEKYAHRIYLAKGHLRMLLRRHIDKDKTPQHIIWLDATGRKEIYENLFERPVEVIDAMPRMQGRIYQMVERLYGKTATSPTKTEQTKRKTKTNYGDQAEQLIRAIIEEHGYERPSLITYKQFVDETSLDTETIKLGHFYASRGTNEHEDADAVFILGTPMPNIYDVVKIAKMIFFERMDAFKVEWCTQDQPYNYIADDGQGRCYPVMGFWKDPDLQSVLEMIREDEIIQAAHRGRPVNHPVDIWLFTNLPISTLPPDGLLTMRDVLGAPEGVDIWKWRKVQELMDSKEAISITDLTDLGLNYETARNYLKVIVTLPEWNLGAVKSRRGKPTLVATKRIIADDVLRNI